MTRTEQRQTSIMEFLSNCRAIPNDYSELQRNRTIDELVTELEKELNTVPSAHKHGDTVYLNFFDAELIGEVTAVHFYPSKVKYDIEIQVDIEGYKTKLYNIDSVFVSSKQREAA